MLDYVSDTSPFIRLLVVLVCLIMAAVTTGRSKDQPGLIVVFYLVAVFGAGLTLTLGSYVPAMYMAMGSMLLGIVIVMLIGKAWVGQAWFRAALLLLAFSVLMSVCTFYLARLTEQDSVEVRSLAAIVEGCASLLVLMTLTLTLFCIITMATRALNMRHGLNTTPGSHVVGYDQTKRPANTPHTSESPSDES